MADYDWSFELPEEEWHFTNGSSIRFFGPSFEEMLEKAEIVDLDHMWTLPARDASQS